MSAPLYSVFLQTLLSAHHSRPRKKNTITVLFHPTTGRLVVLYVVDPSIFFPFPIFGEDIDPDTSNKEQRSFHMPRQRQCIITLKIPIRLTSTHKSDSWPWFGLELPNFRAEPPAVPILMRIRLNCLKLPANHRDNRTPLTR